MKAIVLKALCFGTQSSEKNICITLLNNNIRNYRFRMNKYLRELYRDPDILHEIGVGNRDN